MIVCHCKLKHIFEGWPTFLKIYVTLKFNSCLKFVASGFQGTQLIQMKVAPPSDKSGSESPITSFIKLEQYNAVRLVQGVHASLAALSKVIRGTQLLTQDVQNLAAALLNQEVRKH